MKYMFIYLILLLPLTIAFLLPLETQNLWLTLRYIKFFQARERKKLLLTLTTKKDGFL